MRKALLIAFLLATACTEEPTPAQAEEAMKAVAGREAEAELEAEQKSIEEAADAAAKLVEQEAREEIDAMRAVSNTDQ